MCPNPVCLTYLAGLPHHGSLLAFPPNLYALPKPFDESRVGWPTSVTGGERPGGSNYGPKKRERLHYVHDKRDQNNLFTFEHVIPCALSLEGWCGGGGK